MFLNHVIGPHRDRFAGTPEYKVTAVNVERLHRFSNRPVLSVRRMR